MNKIHDISFLELLPQSIKEDATIASSAFTLDDLLKKTVLSIPNLLLYSRLGGHDSNSMLAPLARLTHARGGLKALSLVELEQLAWQMHVDFREVAKTNDELAQMVRESIAWHRIKGTPRSLINALDLFGYKANVEESGKGSNWAVYQLDVGRQVPEISEARHIVKIAHEMAPVRCKLFRIYNDALDIRPMIWGESLFSYSIYSGFSGVNLPDMPNGQEGDDDVIISFGHHLALESEAYASGFAVISQFQQRGRIIAWPYHPIWGFSLIGQLSPQNDGFTGFSLRTAKIPRKDQAFSIIAQNTPKITLCHSFADEKSKSYGTLGGLNAVYGVRMHTVFPAPFILGEGIFGYDEGTKQIPIFEEFHHEKGVLGDISLARDAHLKSSAIHSKTTLFRNAKEFLLGHFKWGEAPLFYHKSSSLSLRTSFSAEPIYKKQGWSGAWDRRKWLEVIDYDRVREPFSIVPQSHAKSSLCHGFSDGVTYGVLGGLNANNGVPVYKRQAKAHILGESLLGFDEGAEDYAVLEQFIHNKTVETPFNTKKTLVSASNNVKTSKSADIDRTFFASSIQTRLQSFSCDVFVMAGAVMESSAISEQYSHAEKKEFLGQSMGIAVFSKKVPFTENGQWKGAWVGTKKRRWYPYIAYVGVIHNPQ